MQIARIAALYVQTNGVYWNLPGVDCWDVARDARLYRGPDPVVAHPPCNRWSIAAELKRQRDGQDGGCFAHALAAVTQHGGVLEHPAYTLAWQRFLLPEPPSSGGWIRGTLVPGWTCHVEQGHYGHDARKATWLYYVGPRLPPELRWGSCGKSGELGDKYSGQSGKRNRTPVEFRDLLIHIARLACV